ncbi:MAG: hypothetical protein OXB88_09550 [Bacteriovoracales bacterium]|nr:hypothetical protein [Bacteriovoracales bacterium]
MAKGPPLSPKAHALVDFLKERGLDAILVGGFVRDFLRLGTVGNDLDFEVHGDLAPWPKAPREFAEKKEADESIELSFGVYRLRFGDLSMELAPARREEFDGRSGHKSFKAHLTGDYRFEESFKRRDFTVNAIGYDYGKNRWIDPFGGLSDLRRGILHPVGPDFIFDPVRYVRAARFASRETSLSFSPKLKEVLSEMDLSTLSGRSFFSELFKSLDVPLFFRLCQSYNSTLPRQARDLAHILEKCSIKTFQNIDHLRYEYFRLGGKGSCFTPPFVHDKKWKNNFFKTLSSCSVAKWRELLKLTYEDFKKCPEALDYFSLFQSFSRFKPRYSFLREDHQRIFDDFNSMLKSPSLSMDERPHRERGIYRLYSLGQSFL